MLRSLGLSAFKCFERLDLRLAPLTLLSGQNSGGKSSVIQALVLLAQTLEEREWGNALMLNGQEMSLGSASDVINQTVGGREMRIELATDAERVSWLFAAPDRRAMSLDLQSVEVDGRPCAVIPPLRWLQPADIAERSAVIAAVRRVTWLSAERTGPREILPLLDPEHHVRVGARGELAAGLLHWRGDEPVERNLCVSDEIPTLFHQVRAWMRRFFPGADFRLSPVEGTNAITLQMRANAKADFHRPQNVGFGLSQLFPVIVSLMAARPGDTVLVENPEVHLHPRAQQDVGVLLCRVAATGVQVVAETHSDHVVNGIRLAVRQNVITPNDTAVHFFTRGEAGAAQVVSPLLDSNARFDSWPTGFFDQYDAALSELL